MVSAALPPWAEARNYLRMPAAVMPPICLRRIMIQTAAPIAISPQADEGIRRAVRHRADRAKEF
jgi:hypothetical protein